MTTNNNNNQNSSPSWQQSQAQAGQGQAPQNAVDPDLLAQALQGAANLPLPASNRGTYAIERSSGVNLIDLIFNNANGRKHAEVVNYINDVFDENRLGMELSSALILCCGSICLENEAAMEQAIIQNSHSKLALAGAPLYVQLMRQMQLQQLPEIAQTGLNHIKQKLERR